jgi:hypothetical protein
MTGKYIIVVSVRWRLFWAIVFLLVAVLLASHAGGSNFSAALFVAIPGALALISMVRLLAAHIRAIFWY